MVGYGRKYLGWRMDLLRCIYSDDDISCLFLGVETYETF